MRKLLVIISILLVSLLVNVKPFYCEPPHLTADIRYNKHKIAQDESSKIDLLFNNIIETDYDIICSSCGGHCILEFIPNEPKEKEREKVYSDDIDSYPNMGCQSLVYIAMRHRVTCKRCGRMVIFYK